MSTEATSTDAPARAHAASLAQRLPLRVAAVFVVAFVALTVAHFAFSTTLTETDAYYHLHMSLRYRDEGALGVGSQQPQAAHSLYATRFADKEWGYHVLCAPFLIGWSEAPADGDARWSRYVDGDVGARAAARLAAGEPVSWPWEGSDSIERRGKFIAAFWAALLVASVYALFRLHSPSVGSSGFEERWRLAGSGALTLLLLLGGELFWARMFMMRPHVLAIVLLLWIWHATLRKRPMLLFALCTVYVLAHTAAHAPVVLVIVIVLALRLRGERLRGNWRWPVIALGGMVLGFVLHPHPENYLLIFVAQNLTVLSHSALAPLAEALRTSGALDSVGPDLHRLLASDVEFPRPNELRPGLDRELLNALWPLWAGWIVGLLAAAKTRVPLSRETVTLLALSAAWAVMFAGSLRYIEFLVPFATLALGLLLRDVGVALRAHRQPNQSPERSAAKRPAEPARATETRSGMVNTRADASDGDSAAEPVASLRSGIGSDWLVRGFAVVAFGVLMIAGAASVANLHRPDEAILAARHTLLELREREHEAHAAGAQVFHYHVGVGQIGVLMAPGFRYVGTQDDVFIYMADPAKYATIQAVARPRAEALAPGEVDEVADTLRDVFDARFVVAANREYALIKRLERARDASTIIGHKVPWVLDPSTSSLLDAANHEQMWYLGDPFIVIDLATGRTERAARPPDPANAADR